MSSRRLLVLGASIHQLDTIVTAKNRGCTVITLDNVPTNPGHRVADECHDVDTTDRAAVLAVARNAGIDAVVAPGTDVAVATAALVAQELDLVGPPLEAAEIVTSKQRFRALLDRHGMRAPAWRPVHPSSAEVPIDVRPPVVVKPDGSSGSKGVTVVRDDGQMREALEAAWALGGPAVVEQHMAGRQITCEGVLVEGRVAFHAISERTTVPEPHTATSGHLVPASLPPAVGQAMVRDLEQLWAALGVTDGVFDCDAVADEQGVVLLEMSPRLGGNWLAAVIELATGIDLVEVLVAHALGEGVGPLTPRRRRAAGVVLLGAPRAGTLSYDLDQADALTEEPWVEDLAIWTRPGATVRPFIDGRAVIGRALVSADDAASLRARADAVRARLAVDAA